MTREPSKEKVGLTIGNWISLVSLLVTVLGAAWGFTLDVSSRLDTLHEDVSLISERLGNVEDILKPAAGPLQQIQPRKPVNPVAAK